MAGLADRRVVIALGALTAVAFGATVAFGLLRGEPAEAPPPPVAVGPGLQIEVGEVERAQLDPAKPLRCFVSGRFVGLATLAACAERNGVSAQALDVGLDSTGELVAAEELVFSTGTAAETAAVEAPEIEPPAIASTDPVAPDPVVTPASAPVAACLKYGADGWSTMSQAAPLSVCVNLLFDGRCETPGNAQYGRWGEQNVRLVTGKIEIADTPDAGAFRTLVEQTGDCALPRL